MREGRTRAGDLSSLDDAFDAVEGNHHAPINTILIRLSQVAKDEARLTHRLGKLFNVSAVEINRQRHRPSHQMDREGWHYEAAFRLVRW